MTETNTHPHQREETIKKRREQITILSVSTKRHIYKRNFGQRRE